jgi:hypothetical protein
VRDLPACCTDCVFWQTLRGDADWKRRAAWADRTERDFGPWGRVLAEGDEIRGVMQYGPSGAFPRAKVLPAGPPGRDAALVTCAYVSGDDAAESIERLLLEALADIKGRGMTAIELFAMRYPDEVGIYYVNYDADSSTVGFGTFNPTNHDFIVDHAANETCPNFSEFFFSHKGAYVASTSARSLFIRKGSRGRFIEIPVESSGRPIFDTQARTLVVPSQDSGEILVVPLSTQRAQEYLAKGSYPVREVTRVPLRTPDGALDTIVDVDGSNILLERRMASQEDPSAAGIRTLGILSTDTQRWLPLTTSDVNWNGDYPAVVKDENAYYPIEGKASEFFGRKPITLIIKRDLKTGAEKALHQEFLPMSTFSFSWFKLSSGALLLENDKAVGESVFIFQEYGAN